MVLDVTDFRHQTNYAEKGFDRVIYKRTIFKCFRGLEITEFSKKKKKKKKDKALTLPVVCGPGRHKSVPVNCVPFLY